MVGDDVEGGVLLRATPERAHELVDDLPSTLINLERSNGVLKIAGFGEGRSAGIPARRRLGLTVGESVGSKGAELRKLVVGTVGLQNDA